MYFLQGLEPRRLQKEALKDDLVKDINHLPLPQENPNLKQGLLIVSSDVSRRV